MALVIVPNSTKFGHMSDKNIVNDLDWLQRTVCGYIESLHFRTPVNVAGEEYAGMIINEEGKLMDLAVNWVATLIARDGGLPVSDHIVGTAILFKKGEIE